MKNKEKETDTIKKKEDNYSIYKVFSTISLVISIGYLTYKLLKIDNIITNIYEISIPIFILIVAIIMFINSLKLKEKNLIFITISIVIFLFIGFNIANDTGIIKLPEDEKIISYTNAPYKNLNEWAEKNHIKLDIIYEYSDEIEKGNIIRIDVNEGTYVKDIKKITATISNGPDYDKIVIIPSMTGWNIDDAVEFINKNHMINVNINYEDDSSEKDIIIKQNKNGEIRRNQEFILTVSYGKDEIENIEMIDLKNKTLFDGTLWLKRNKIKYSLEYEFSDTIERNTIIKQNIEIGENINVNETSVTITISKGKAIKVPNLLNMKVEDITNWVMENKLKISFEEIYDEKIETGKVIKANVNKNDSIEQGFEIILTISKGQIKMQKFNSLYEFKEWANKYNINYYETYEYNNTVSKGNVISYSYNENDIINPDEVIYVKVSLGKSITIPSFIGKTKNEANNICNSIGIRCSFTTGTYTNYNQNVVYAQSKNTGTTVGSGASITLTLSKGIPQTKNLSILQNWISIGNADATIASLKNNFNEYYPGVNFNFIKVKDNTLNSGMIAKNSPTNSGTPVKQGNTYTIYVVAN